MDKGAWRAIAHGGAESDTTDGLTLSITLANLAIKSQFTEHRVCCGLGLGQAWGMEGWVRELGPGRSRSGKRLICLTICDWEGCWVSRSEVKWSCQICS